jgi:phospholipid/cholesterol/gamma-HCH transport system permease protein
MATLTSSAQGLWLEGEGRWTLRLAGDWRGRAALALPPPPRPITAGSVCVDGSALVQWDGALTAALHDRLAPLQQSGVALDLLQLPGAVKSALELALGAGAAAVVTVEPAAGVAAVGERLLRAAAEALATAAFFGDVVAAFGRLLRGRSGMQGSELLRQLDDAGPLSLPIVTLTCSLVGLILAYMGGAQLDRIGAQGFVADVVTVGMVRELAAMMIGVILAGRLGAAYAAQIGTMKAGEEIDALRALGLDPIDHLVLPRLLALLLMAPLLIAYGMLVGVIAGLPAAAFVYGVPALEYLHDARNALTWTHLWIGLFKGTMYAVLVALAGCREGLSAGRNAQAVGAATTTAVVKALVWIVIAACVSTVAFQTMGL